MGKIDFFDYELKPISLKILTVLREIDGPATYQEIEEKSGLHTKQISASLTKTLVRYGLCERYSKLTRLLKKEYNVIAITDKGKKYLEILKEKERISNDSN